MFNNFFIKVLDGKPIYIEMAGNLVPITKSDNQMSLKVRSFHENRLHILVRLRDIDDKPKGRVYFMKNPNIESLEDDPQIPICNLILRLPKPIITESIRSSKEDISVQKVEDSGWV